MSQRLSSSCCGSRGSFASGHQLLASRGRFDRCHSVLDVFQAALFDSFEVRFSAFRVELADEQEDHGERDQQLHRGDGLSGLVLAWE